MSDGFKEREKALEAKYFRDEEFLFKVASRRRKLLGLWAAGKMHKTEEESLSYALSIVKFGVSDNTEGAVVMHLLSDLNKAGIMLNERDIRHKMAELEDVAKHQLEDELFPKK